jgi:hypothetical protein
MSLQVVTLFLCLMISAAPGRADAQEQKRAPNKAEQEALDRAKQQEREKAKVEVTPRKRGRDLNLQIELTITDTQGSAKPETKVVSMLTADGWMGRIRTVAGPMSAMLNVDATPTVLENDRIRMQLTVEYAPAPTGQPSQKLATLHESLNVILQNGKPLVISQAADPVTDRKMTVEIKASIVK